MDDIGEIRHVEIQKNGWPMITMIVSLVISIIIIFANIRRLDFVLLLAVLLYWLIFLLIQVYRLSRKKIFKFGTEGCICYYCKGKYISKVLIMYSDIHQPKFDITDYMVNGYHSTYIFSIDFGRVSFSYNYNDDDIPTQDFDYICAHILYRCWSKYQTGKELDYNESDRIVFGMLRNKMKETS